jgi:hypothetical protein
MFATFAARGLIAAEINGVRVSPVDSPLSP